MKNKISILIVGILIGAAGTAVAFKFIQSKSHAGTTAPQVAENQGAFMVPRCAVNDSCGDEKNSSEGHAFTPPEIRAVPNTFPGSPGVINGFRMVDIPKNSLLSKLGVKDGDIITTVNGEALDSPAKAMEFYNNLKSNQQVQFVIERNGSTLTKTYNIK